MKVIELNHPSHSLNIRQLFNPLFYSPVERHPDAKRQRKARVEARALRQARTLKTMYVPRNLVAPLDPPEPHPWEYELSRGYGSAYRRRVVTQCKEPKL